MTSKEHVQNTMVVMEPKAKTKYKTKKEKEKDWPSKNWPP
jgi:hypothetical protein